MSYRVELTANARKQLLVLKNPIYDRIREALLNLRDEPRPTGARKLKGRPDGWRLRVGDYRILYDIHDGVLLVDIFRIAHRREAYR